MAEFLTRAGTDMVINAFIGEAAFELDDADVVIFTEPPTELGTDGVEVDGGSYTRQPYVGTPSGPGTAGQTGKTVSTNGMLFPAMPVASADIEGIGLARRSDGVIFAVNDTWTPTEPFDIGGNLFIGAGDFAFFGKKS